jgi:hypothetical protein
VLTDRFLLVVLEWVVVAAATWVCALRLFFIAYRRTHQCRPPFETWLTMALSPISLMRARTVVSFAAASAVHPLAAGAALCGDREFLRIARLWWFDDVACRPQLEQIARDRGLHERLIAAPDSWEPGAAQFCPRCHETYTSGASCCSDCDQVELEPLAG